MSNMVTSTVSAGSFAKEVRAKLQQKEQQSNAVQSDILQKKASNLSDEEKNHQASMLSASMKQQTTAIKHAVQMNTKTISDKLTDKPVRRSREERVYDTVMAALAKYKTAAIGSLDRILALQSAMTGSLKQPKKHLLDAVLNFFKENKDEDSFSELNSLQNITRLTPSSRLQTEIFFRLFMMLATHTANKRTLSLNQLRSIFKNEDFLNWVAVTMSRD